MTRAAQSRITAVLGPTNTGKTHLAIDRLLGYRNGIIGFPLRLLARENYDRAIKVKGARQVALVTGEEKIVPPGARYFFCTVESMPVDRRVEYLAVDEIQLCADPERGHVFTDRLLYARGTEETMFLGADTIRPVLRKLVPEADCIARPRFSTLSYSGPKKITRLPRRSAVIAFSAADVYAIAELMRRQRGGTAVVLGALSPRTRNAQVALFEAGEVDYLVATDAIGMGLNLNLDHVAFSRLSKFDGRGPRRLMAAEIAQIAGRAGRHMSDGTFGTTAELGAMSEELVEAVENHRFEKLPRVYWRSRDLDMRAPERLLKSLDRRSPAPELLRVRDAEDHQALATLARDPEILALAANPDAVRLLWEVCQVPDFQKILSDQHSRLLSLLYRHLMAGEGRLPVDWVARQIARIDRVEGDIDALVARIAQVRTWTYVSHRGDWVDDPEHWQGRTRAIEDRLSDALHDRLTHRFVDRRTAMLVRRLQGGEELLGAVKADGDVLVEGVYVGRLVGFRFEPDVLAGDGDAKALFTAARRALVTEIPARVQRVEGDEDRAFQLDDHARICWHGVPLARLAPGERPLAPRIEILPSEFLDGPQRERLRRRLAAWLESHLRHELKPLYRVIDSELTGSARGLLFQVVEALGTLPRGPIARQLAELSKAERKGLNELGLRLGAASIYLPALIKPRTARLRALLWAIHAGTAVPSLPTSAVTSLRPDPEAGLPAETGFWHAAGYRLFARGGEAMALRADVLERLAREARRLGAQGGFGATPALCRLAGCDETGLSLILTGLGYRAQNGVDGLTFVPRRGTKRKAKKGDGARSKPRAATRKKGKTGGEAEPAAESDSPFAKLRHLKITP